MKSNRASVEWVGPLCACAPGALWYSGVKLRDLVPLWLNYRTPHFATKTLGHKEKHEVVNIVIQYFIKICELPFVNYQLANTTLEITPLINPHGGHVFVECIFIFLTQFHLTVFVQRALQRV